MTLYKTTITPLSNFITTLKGDTFFGQLCWAVRFNFGEERLRTLLNSYEISPFLIVSDAFAKGFVPKPTMPSQFLKEDVTKKKDNRKKRWLSLNELQNNLFSHAKTNEEAGYNLNSEVIIKNSINRKNGSTGDGFDPYAQHEFTLSEQDIYFLIDTSFSDKELEQCLTTVANMGYGKESSTGKGRFEFLPLEKISIENRSQTFMALSPFIAYDIECENLFYEPFVRFGKTGASRANKNAFKKPIVLADSGAVITFNVKTIKQYIGKAITNISTYQDIVHQGYAIVIPLQGLDYE